ncbi:MAG TPA: hypothetical protein VHP33_39230 [Polyangiaceae bacterium]|nr:hypothetical protein [Polyangiaceae bacterium]
MACSPSTDPSGAGTAGQPGAAGSAASTGGAGSPAGGATTAPAGASTGGTAGAVGNGGVSSGGQGPAAGVGGLGGSAGAPVGGSGGAAPVAGCQGKPLCWDFEEGKIPTGFVPWRTTPSPATGSLLVDDTKPFGGKGYSLHAKDLVGGPQHTLKYVLPTGFGPVMWGRMRLYTTPTRPEAHAGFFNARYPKPGQPDNAAENQLNWYEVASYKQAYMSIFHPPWPPGFPEDVQVSDTKLVLDKWTCVEWLFDGKNDADATQAALPKMWLDGTELLWPEHFTYSEPAGAAAPFRDKVGNFTVIELGIVTWQEVPTPTSWWIDDVALGKERIGCN